MTLPAPITRYECPVDFVSMGMLIIGKMHSMTRLAVAYILR